MGRTSSWTRADPSWGNHTGSSWVCQLYFGEIYDIYWARVRATEGGELSPWVYSNELQPYRDSKDQGAPSATSLLLLGGLMGREVLGEVGKVPGQRNREGSKEKGSV